jgi:sucrose phosphorylase
VRNQVQLITYADRLAGTLPRLRELLVSGPLAGLFGGVHVLPCFTPFDGADAGFDPVDHLTVDPRLGTWDDVRAIAADLDVVADVIVNHVSTESAAFLDWAREGDASPYAGMFLTMSSVFPAGATEAELLRIYRPRPGLPFTPVTVHGGERHLLWTTFTSRQADIDVNHPAGRRYLCAILDRLAEADVAMVRLDAVGYAVKTAGTSSFMTEDTLAFVDELSGEAHARGLRVLVELHSHHSMQLEIARRVDCVYDFALPPLVLHALTTGDAEPLRGWIDERPHNAVTVLDTHDGIGVIDVGADATDHTLAGLLAAPEIDALVERMHENTGGTSRRATGAAASNLDLYQVNTTFYDALARDDARYLLARLVQFFLPGVPQVYYVGLLAGGNDMALLAETGVGRDVNRHHYTPEEVDEALERPVVRALMAAIRFRNAHPAFGGEFASRPAPPGRLDLRWRAPDGSEVALEADLRAATWEVVERDGAGAERRTSDALALA